ncbi:sugar ABC transporter permease [Ensifer soli]|uniref:sugar ABC transporter permease n=1 Tax=Ciceribacter sp. sgz301302 TaxID=3342379 RepID=UPI0035B77594
MNKDAVLGFIKNNATLIALIVLAVGLSFADDSFFTARNLSNLARQVTIIGIIAVGMTMVILISGIDLSVGSVAGLAAIVVTTLMQHDVNVWVSIVITLVLVGGLIGAWNGFWIAHYRIPPFIITLGMLTIARGLALTISDGSSVPVTDTTFPLIGGAYIPPMASVVIIVAVFLVMLYATFRSAARARKVGAPVDTVQIATSLLMACAGLVLSLYMFGSYQGIPVPVAIFAVIAAAGILILSQTRLGRRLYALGGNEDAARLSGIDVYRTKLLVYITVSVLSALAGILLASRLNGASPNLGTMFELDAIASVVIGGTSLAGGSGTIGGTVIGALIIGVLNNGMSLLGVSTFYQLIIKGFIIIVAVWFDVLQKRK